MDKNENFDFVCNEDELKESIGKRFYVNDTDIAVFKVKGNIYAVSNICPHQHAAAIYEGFVENESVVCPLHGWEFNLKNGRLHTGGGGLDTYPVKIVDGKIFAQVKKKELNW